MILFAHVTQIHTELIQCMSKSLKGDRWNIVIFQQRKSED